MLRLERKRLSSERLLVRIYVELDYLRDLFCEYNTYLDIYMLKKHIQTTASFCCTIYCEAHTSIATFTEAT